MLVLSGDVPLVSAGTLHRLIEAARNGWAAMAVAELEDPGSLGRVVAGPLGRLAKIVEAADASPEELSIGRVNAGLYALPTPDIFTFLRALRPDNAKGELYLTDALNAAAGEGHPIELVEIADPTESWGVNTRADLGRAHRTLLARHSAALQEAGVSILDPARTTIEATVQVGEDTVVHPSVSLLGATRVGRGCVLEQGAWLRDVTVGDGTRIAPYSVLEDAEVAADCQVGPFARLRPGAVIGQGAKVGNFVEVKKSELGRGVKVNHLAYVGDASVGDGTNIGAGTVTCNYDGTRKSATRIGRNVFIGSDTMLVAPVEVGDDAMTAAGSVVTKDVPAGALAVGRAVQRNIAEWARRFGPRKGR
jgi:bifunctional UDP-N-acetylglucosamine pyrophosphorylase/glucosamine-1-phosphate N-acetyltransferase